MFRSVTPDPFVGHWYEYHVSRSDGQRILVAGILYIRRSTSGQYRARYDHEDVPGFEPSSRRYVGTGRVLEDHLTLDLSGVSHGESLHYQFSRRLASNRGATTGIWVGFDQDHRPAAAPALICRQRQSASIVDVELGFSDLIMVPRPTRCTLDPKATNLEQEEQS